MDTTDRDSEGTAPSALAPRPLAELLAAEEAAFAKGPVCTVAVILDQLDAADASVLVAWMANPVKRHSWIAEALKKNGHPIQESTIGRHRNRKCGCW